MVAFHSRNCHEITVTGRTFENARHLEEKVNAATLDFESFRKSLHLFDVVVTSTAGNDPVLSRETIRSALSMRPARPLFLIDVAVPRDIDEGVSELENVYLYNMDDVSAIANENLKSRMAEVERCKGALAHRAIRLWQQMVHQPSPPS